MIGADRMKENGISFGAVILCGGQSRRMGRDKAQLLLGQETFLERLAETLSCFDELMLAPGRADRYPWIHGRIAEDRFPGCGPMAGLHAALEESERDAVVCVPCDVPLFPARLARRLCRELDGGSDAVICAGQDGLHPLCGVYRKTAAEAFQRRLEQGDYRIRSALEQLRVKQLQISDCGCDPAVLTNVNDRGAYDRLCRGRREG